ncbi:metallophosphoesterase [Planotetraspora phitsanulokensis]|uniref:Membrane protein n=1 Tax=Planotetraspora phitsanulokensis TaxID=575192 RepID=A0A8J3U9D2_9ACTN|nr:metallophosphoesterase [Planotetraspora phitsanulokensis]GII39226.1 membrane protein [Planotetraspora phitsanulokensis]
MGFGIAIVVAVAVVHYYLWRRVIRPATAPGSRTRRVAVWALFLLAAPLVLTRAGGRIFGTGFEHFIAWPGYLWLAIMFYLLVFSLVLEIPRALALLVVRRIERREASAAGAAAPASQNELPVAALAASGASTSEVASGASSPASADVTSQDGRQEDAAPAVPAPGRIDRRMFIARTASAVVGVGALATVGYGVATALGDPVVERVPIRLPRLDPRMNGLRIAVVSDIHLGPLTGIGHTERITRMINGLQADVVTIVGDLVDGSVAELGALAAPLKDLESRYGAYFVTGNHEYYTSEGPQEWIEELDSLGVRSLRNERVEISHNGAVLDLAGVNDLNGASYGDGPDFDKALAGRDAARPVVLLAHQPVQVETAAGHGVDLQLSGHTHGGQIAPFNLVVKLQQPVVAGLAAFPRTGGGETQVYVTRGAGYWGPPVRVGAPPEITLVELHA